MKMADMSTLVPQSRKADGSTAPARIVICGEVSAGKSTVLNALLRDHVTDREGNTHDIVILSHDVARVSAQHEAMGLSEAF